MFSGSKVMACITIVIMMAVNGCAPSSKDEKQANGFLDSFPRHSQEFSQVPEYVVIKFKNKINKDSRIVVSRDNEDAGNDNTMISRDGQSMSVSLKNRGDGDYMVEYDVRDGQGETGKGRFSFIVDRAIAKTYTDRSGITDVLIEITKNGLIPEDVLVTKGARVTWLNRDVMAHRIVSGPYGVSDSGLRFSSPLLKEGQLFTFVVDDVGEWTYRYATGSKNGSAAHMLVEEGTLSTELKQTEPPKKSAPIEAEPSIGQIEKVAIPGFKISNPLHGAVLKSVPFEVSIEFDKRIGTRSNIRVSKTMADMNLGPTEISSDRRTMLVQISPEGGKGVYLVKYRVYWTDTNISNGQFAFEVR